MSNLVLEFESVYLDELPHCTQYERSFMHRDVISHVLVTKSGFFFSSFLFSLLGTGSTHTTLLTSCL